MVACFCLSEVTASEWMSGRSERMTPHTHSASTVEITHWYCSAAGGWLAAPGCGGVELDVITWRMWWLINSVRDPFIILISGLFCALTHREKCSERITDGDFFFIGGSEMQKGSEKARIFWIINSQKVFTAFFHVYTRNLEESVRIVYICRLKCVTAQDVQDEQITFINKLESDSPSVNCLHWLEKHTAKSRLQTTSASWSCPWAFSVMYCLLSHQSEDSWVINKKLFSISKHLI